MCSRASWCCGRSYFVDHLNDYIKSIKENEEEYRYFTYRFSRLIKRLEESTKRSSFWYYSLSALVTVGSILVPSLIAVQEKSWKADANSEEQQQHEHNVYWSVWAISLSVTLGNAFIKLLALDKTYITRNLRLNQFRSEAMKYITKSARYAINDENQAFHLFVQNIERLREQQILEEYTPQNNSDITNNATYV